MTATPSVEILYDSYDDAFEWNGAAGEEMELIELHTPWADWFRRQNDRIFFYRHRITNAVVVAAWIYSPAEAAKPIYMDLLAVADPGKGWWPDELPAPSVLRKMLRPLDEKLAEMEQQDRDAAYEKKRKALVNKESKEDAIRYYKRRGMDEEANMLRFSPWNVDENTRGI